VGAELFHEVRRTDMTSLLVTYHNFAQAPKEVEISPRYGANKSRTVHSIGMFRGAKGWCLQNESDFCSIPNTVQIPGMKQDSQTVYESVINAKYRRRIDSLKASQNPPANWSHYVPLGVKKWHNLVHFVSSQLSDLRLIVIFFYSEENVSQRHFVHRKSYMDWSGKETRTPRWENGD
jgi:hypothetical protein